jgi:hypothetical protein
VDLGELRKHVAIAYGEEAPSTCWTAGNELWYFTARDLPAWDATAALNTSTESHGPCDAAPGETSFLAPRSPSSDTSIRSLTLKYGP